MSSPYLGEIRMFGGSFAPAGWAFCDGSLVSISDNDALFTLIGTTYGGDGQETFALPDLRGRIPVHQGGGYQLGQNGGSEEVTLTVNQIPGHGHAYMGSTDIATQVSPAGQVVGQSTSAQLFRTAGGVQDFATNAIGPSGGSQPHTNLQPYLCINFIIALAGIFPPQS